MGRPINEESMIFRLFLPIFIALTPVSADAALIKQCKHEIYVDAQIPVIPVGVVLSPDAAKKAKNAATYRAQRK